MTTFGARVLTGGILTVIGLITVRVIMALFGAVVGFVSFLLFTVLPIVLFGWLALKLLKYLTRERDKDKPAYE